MTYIPDFLTFVCFQSINMISLVLCPDNISFCNFFFCNRATFSALSCPEFSHYEVCTSACPASCSELTAHLHCTHPCTEGCQCDQGYVLSGSRCVRREDCGCEQDGLYYPLNETFWAGETGELGGECSQRCVCGPAGEVSCFNDSCREGEVCVAEVGLLGCYPRREGVCFLSQTQVQSTFDGIVLPIPDESSFYMVKPCAVLPANVSAVEVKMGRKLVNKGPTWMRPVVVRVGHLEAQIGGSDFDSAKVCQTFWETFSFRQDRYVYACVYVFCQCTLKTTLLT